jgi:hypothetical protein
MGRVLESPADSSAFKKAALNPRTRKPGSSKPLVNFWLDVALLVIFVGMVWVSVLLRFVFPPGPLATGWKLWGYSFDDWAGVQFGLLATLTLGILVHVMLHWSWVCGIIATRIVRSKQARLDEGLQTIYGVALLIFLLLVVGVGLALGSLMIERG